MHGENDDLGASPCTLQVEEAQNTKDIYMYIICNNNARPLTFTLQT